MSEPVENAVKIPSPGKSRIVYVRRSRQVFVSRVESVCTVEISGNDSKARKIYVLENVDRHDRSYVFTYSRYSEPLRDGYKVVVVLSSGKKAELSVEEYAEVDGSEI